MVNLGIFPLQSSKKDEIEIIDRLKRLHRRFRNDAILHTRNGHTSGSWNTAKTIIKILEKSDFSFILNKKEFEEFIENE